MNRKTIATIAFVFTVLFLSDSESKGQTVRTAGMCTATYPADSIETCMERPFPHPAYDLSATTPWTLRDCIDYARENNIEILQQELSVEDAALAKKQTKLNYIPSASASLGSGTSFGRVLDTTTYEFRENDSNTDLSASVSVGTEIFAGMRKYHQMKRADLNLEDMLLRVEKARNDLELNITAAYLEILFAEERLVIAEKRTETLSLQVEQVSKLVEAGRKTVGDLLQLQSELADASYQSIEARNQRTLAYFNLCQLLEINDFEAFRIYVPESLSVAGEGLSDTPDTIAAMAQELPQIKSAELSLDIADQDIKIARSALYPTLSLSAGYGTSFSNGRLMPDPNNPNTYITYPFKEQIRNNASYHVSLGLSIPIFNSLSARNNVKSYRIARLRAEYSYMIIQKNLNRDIRQAYLDATAAYEQYAAALRNIATSEEAFRMVEEKYNLGAASPVDYSIALYNLFTARSQVAQAKYSYIFKTKILDFYKGVPIEL